MKGPVRCKCLLLAVVLCCSVAIPCLAQNDQAASARKVISKVNPSYPALARTMNLSGVVRLEAVVLANGTVKTVQVKGGNPLLAQAAENAVRAWRWEKLDRDTTEVLEFHFTP